MTGAFRPAPTRSARASRTGPARETRERRLPRPVDDATGDVDRSRRRMDALAGGDRVALDLAPVREAHAEQLRTGVVVRVDPRRPRRLRAAQSLTVRVDEEEPPVLDDTVRPDQNLVRVGEAEALDGRDGDPRDAPHAGARCESYIPHSSRSSLQISPIVQRARSASRSGGSRFSVPLAASRTRASARRCFLRVSLGAHARRPLELAALGLRVEPVQLDRLLPRPRGTG